MSSEAADGAPSARGDAGGDRGRRRRVRRAPRRSRARAAAAARPRRRSGASAARRSARATSSCSPLVLLYPFVASPFFTFQIGAQSLALGLIALSLTFLGGYGGMVSLAQMTVAGFAGYVRGDLRQQQHRGDQPRLAVVAGARASRSSLATVFAAAVGWLSVRTEGIYTIMITLAVGVAFFYLAQQNYTRLQRLPGLQQDRAADRVRRRLARAGALLLPRARLRAGRLLLRQAPGARARSASRCRASATTRAACSRSAIDVTAHRVAAYAVAGLLAAVGGVLMVWYNGRISPGTDRHRRDDQHPDHRRARRHEAPDRRLRRRDRLRAAAELRDRPGRPRALQPRDRRGLPRDRAVFPRRPARAVAACASLRLASSLQPRPHSPTRRGDET